jgi:tetratricopeptide (TPR) repeat protein
VTDAEGEFGQALNLLRAAENHWGASIALNNLGVLVFESGRYAEAERYLTESLELGMRLGDPWRKLMALGSLGELYLGQGKPDRAAEVMTQVFVLQHDTHNIFSLPNDLEACALLAVSVAQPECALRLAGAADTVRRRFAAPSQLEPQIRTAMDEARRTLGPDGAKDARQYGAAMTMEEAIDYALSWLRNVAASYAKSPESELTFRPGG